MDVRFTDRELDIIEVLWRTGPSTVAEVRAALEDELAYNTVLTMLRVLEEKGHVTRELTEELRKVLANARNEAKKKAASRKPKKGRMT